MTPENELLALLQAAIGSKRAVEQAISDRNRDIRTILYKQEVEAFSQDEQLKTLRPQVEEWSTLIKQTSEDLLSRGTLVRLGMYHYVVDHAEENTYTGLTLWVLQVTDPPARRRSFERIGIEGTEIVSLRDIPPTLRKTAERLIARLRLKVWKRKNNDE